MNDNDDTTVGVGLRDLYESVTANTRGPDVAVMNGALVNNVTGTEDYDPHEAYYVSKEGITRIE